MEAILKEFAERLREFGIEKQLTLMQLAKEIGVSDIAISKWKNM